MDCCSHEGPAKGDAKFDFKKIADGVRVAVAALAYKVNRNPAIAEQDTRPGCTIRTSGRCNPTLSTKETTRWRK